MIWRFQGITSTRNSLHKAFPGHRLAVSKLHAGILHKAVSIRPSLEFWIMGRRHGLTARTNPPETTIAKAAPSCQPPTHPSRSVLVEPCQNDFENTNGFPCQLTRAMRVESSPGFEHDNLPPVLGPVMTMAVNSLPKCISFATAF